MTLEEAKELFPEVTKKRPKPAIGYIYVTYEHTSHKFYIGKQTRTYWSESYYGGGHYPQQWKRDNLPMSHWPIQWCYSKEELAKAEFNWIDRYKEHPDITNLTAGGRGGRGGGWAKPISDELHQMFSEIRMGADNPFFGKNHTEESKQKMSRSIKKYFETHENPRKNTKASEESKEKMRKSSALRWARPENKYQYATKILCVETGEIFNSISDASKAVNGDISNISAACRGYKGRKTACGYHWKYLNGVGDIREIKHVRTDEQRETMSKASSSRNKKERTDFMPKERPYKGYFKTMIKVQCIETGEIFNCIADAKKAYGLKGGGIGKACRGETKTACGYHWRYYDEEGN